MQRRNRSNSPSSRSERFLDRTEPIGKGFFEDLGVAVTGSVFAGTIAAVALVLAAVALGLVIAWNADNGKRIANPTTEYNLVGTNITQNTWTTLNMTVFANDTAGQGNSAGGTAWIVPANGVYSVHSSCLVTPSAYITTDSAFAKMRIFFNGIFAPPGGQSSTNLYTPIPSAPTITPSIVIGSTVQVCPTCSVHVGDPLTLTVRYDHSTGGNASAAPSMGTASNFGVLAAVSVTNSATGSLTVVNGDVGTKSISIISTF